MLKIMTKQNVLMFLLFFRQNKSNAIYQKNNTTENQKSLATTNQDILTNTNNESQHSR